MTNESTESSNKAAENFKTLVGGTVMSVLTLDGEEAIFVRQLPVKAYPDLFRCLGDEIARVCLYTMRAGPVSGETSNLKLQTSGNLESSNFKLPASVEWVEALLPESHEAILKEGEKLNAAFFGRWLERKRTAEALLPKTDMAEVAAIIGVLEKSNPEALERLMAKAVSILPATAPKSPAPAALPASK